jgi:hypothetical protein
MWGALPDLFSDHAERRLPWDAPTISVPTGADGDGGHPHAPEKGDSRMGSVVKKRRKRMAKKKHRKLLRKTRVQRRRLGK